MLSRLGAGREGRTMTTTRDNGPSGADEPRLLAGGNQQIPKGDGDAPVQAYIEAMPGWRRDVGRHLDALIVRTVPDVRKAVRCMAWRAKVVRCAVRGRRRRQSRAGVVGQEPGRHSCSREVPSRYARVGAPNQVASTSPGAGSARSPTQAT
jgi:hypothetical protein